MRALLFQACCGVEFPTRYRKLAEEGLIELCGTPETIAEFDRALGYEKFRERINQLNLDVSSIVDFYSDLITFFESEELADIVGKEDPDDDIFISAALASASELIVPVIAICSLWEFKNSEKRH